MSIHVLIVATRYNKAAQFTYRWAEKLRDDLLSRSAVETCLLFDGESLCHSGTALSDAIERVDFVVFYGHGEADHWISIPAGSAANSIALIDANTVSVFNGKKVYAACCKSLSQLGAAFAGAYKNNNPAPDFVGYSTDFNFHIPNEDEFRRIVHESVRDFILGTRTAATIVADQKAEWTALETKFRTGAFQTYPDALFAANCAKANAGSIAKA
jgi:hypothetical protein